MCERCIVFFSKYSLYMEFMSKKENGEKEMRENI